MLFRQPGHLISSLPFPSHLPPPADISAPTVSRPIGRHFTQQLFTEVPKHGKHPVSSLYILKVNHRPFTIEALFLSFQCPVAATRPDSKQVLNNHLPSECKVNTGSNLEGQSPVMLLLPIYIIWTNHVIAGFYFPICSRRVYLHVGTFLTTFHAMFCLKRKMGKVVQRSF